MSEDINQENNNPNDIKLKVTELPIFNQIKKLVQEEMQQPRKYNKFKYPLSEQTYDSEEICAMIKVLLSNKLTMGYEVQQFEKEFAKFLKVKYAIMVNSGSSANLLAIAALTNYMCKNKLEKGDKIIVPTICWSTSVWPLIQCGLEPVFVDVEQLTLNADIRQIEKLVEQDNKIRGIMAVHILGNCTNMEKMMEIVEKHNLIMMEDTCESLGSTYDGKYLGTFGKCGTFSFYFSHHITTIEGGMVVTNDEDIYEILKCLRTHGWSREQKNKEEYEQKYANIDSKFLFINVGYNFRPMEIQAAMGRIQLGKLISQNENRKQNYREITIKIQKICEETKKMNLICMNNTDKCDAAWFALPFLLNESINKKEYLKKVEERGIDTRPVVTGNFARQPAFELFNIDVDPSIYANAERIHDRGFFIGLPARKLDNEEIDEIVDILLSCCE